MTRNIDNRNGDHTMTTTTTADLDALAAATSSTLCERRYIAGRAEAILSAGIVDDPTEAIEIARDEWRDDPAAAALSAHAEGWYDLLGGADVDGAEWRAAVRAMDGEEVRDDDGALLGVVYRDHGRWYAADVDDVWELAVSVAAREYAPHGTESPYSGWCADTIPAGEGDTREEAMIDAGWMPDPDPVADAVEAVAS